MKEPLTQRVLDPSCGSGTFLFHAVRAYRRAADEAGIPLSERAGLAAGLIAGMNLHPVAAIIARVTYILALGPAADARRIHASSRHRAPQRSAPSASWPSLARPPTT